MGKEKKITFRTEILSMCLKEKNLFQFSNLLGTVYRQGDIIFSHDGNTIICPVGNKISVYDLRNNRAHTLPIEARYNYTTLALAPNGIILIAAEEGKCFCCCTIT